MEKEFVPYELSLRLKAIDFNEHCLGFYITPLGSKEEKLIIKVRKTRKSVICIAPTYSQAFRFFREKHNLITYIGWVYKKTKGIDWFFNIKGIEMINNNVLPHNEIRFDTYEEAELACLEKLLEICSSK